MASKPLVLTKYDIFLQNDDDFLHEDLVRMLKLIFNVNWKEANEICVNAKKKGQIVIERVHKEKLDLRKEQIKAWNDKGEHVAPIAFVKVIGG